MPYSYVLLPFFQCESNEHHWFRARTKLNFPKSDLVSNRFNYIWMMLYYSDFNGNLIQRKIGEARIQFYVYNTQTDMLPIQMMRWWSFKLGNSLLNICEGFKIKLFRIQKSATAASQQRWFIQWNCFCFHHTRTKCQLDKCN